VPLTLTFEDAAQKTFTVEVNAPVRALGVKAMPMSPDMKPGMEHKN
jgi:hypothetical protein